MFQTLLPASLIWVLTRPIAGVRGPLAPGQEGPSGQKEHKRESQLWASAMFFYPEVREVDSGAVLGGSELLCNAISELKFGISKPLRVSSHLLFISPHEISAITSTLFTNEAQRSQSLRYLRQPWLQHAQSQHLIFFFNSTKSFKPKEESGTDKDGVEGTLIAGSCSSPVFASLLLGTVM